MMKNSPRIIFAHNLRFILLTLVYIGMQTRAVSKFILVERTCARWMRANAFNNANLF